MVGKDKEGHFYRVSVDEYPLSFATLSPRRTQAVAAAGDIFSICAKRLWLMPGSHAAR
jgi:hypothetical protein